MRAVYSRVVRTIKSKTIRELAAELSVDKSTFDSKFSVQGPIATKNVGFTTLELNMKYLSDYSRVVRCQDIKARIKDSFQGNLYNGNLKAYNLASSVVIDFIKRLDAKNAKDGCP